MIEERRKYKRVQDNLRIVYTIAGDPAEFTVYSINMSAGGFCFGLDRLLEIDTVLEFTVFLPEKDRSFTCSGKVTWQNPLGIKDKDGRSFYTTGLQFQNLTLTNRLMLISHVHDRLKREKKERL